MLHIIYINNNYYYHVDIDECTTGVDTCEQTCQNNNGSYICTCRQGFRLHSDGQQCDGELNMGHTIFTLLIKISIRYK